MTDMIKKQYLGGEKLKKKMLKPSEKFKFNFDWEAGDDTSKDLNPLYNNTHEAQLLFGRGLRAGVDRREQKKVKPCSALMVVLLGSVLTVMLGYSCAPPCFLFSQAMCGAMKTKAVACAADPWALLYMISL